MTMAWSPGAGISRRLQRRWGAEVCPIDRELELIVGKALAKERERRYQSAGELARDIERYLAGEALEARRDSLAYVLWKQSRRLLRQAPAVALAIVCAVLMPGLIASLAFWRSAVRERDIAQTTIAFLNHDVFQALDPEAMGRGVDLRDLLDAASKQIDERFGDAPSAEASIRQSVGSLYASLGENDKARQHLERALALQRAEYGNDHLSVAETLQALAPVLEIQGQVAEAERCLDEALAIRRHRLGENHPQVATTLAQVAAFATRRGDLERAASLGGTPAPSPPSARPAGENAVELAEQRLRDARQTYEEGHPQIAQQLVELAEALLAAGDRSQAADRLLQVLDIHTRQFGSEHPRTRATFARVERVLEQIDGLERLLPALTARLASARESNNNARLLADAAWDVVKFPGYPAEQYEEARAAAERAAALRPSDGSYLNTLGVAQYRTGRFAEAVATLQKSDELNSGHPADVAFLAMALHRADQPDAAREQLTRLEKAAAEAPWSTDAQTQRFLAEARAALGVS
jgi:tetratricopeptide (TPR) repeat protein